MFEPEQPVVQGEKNSFFERNLQPASREGLRYRLYRLLFHHESRDERNFDLALTVIIIASVLVVMLDSEASIKARWHTWLFVAEWIFTLLFTVEYAVRIWVLRAPLRYANSFLGIVDLLAILPTFLALLFPASVSLTVIRILRLLRIFRILKLVKYSDEAGLLIQSLIRSRRKILIFVTTLITIAVIFGALMYLVEGPEHGFDSIPTGVYWAIVTMATVGYGDLSPGTGLGRFLTSALIIIGYSIIVVPTGIYSAELARNIRGHGRKQVRCSQCSLNEHNIDAWYCRKCGTALPHAGSDLN
ncbi:MAG: ion transporter [Thermomonas sp.]|uniref:ion transporter n=1 Tax=Thermomonas sp. TaxID=1971895 RepID=UPI001ECC9C45|nr:ion transporter [Thermomonas sp.]MBV2208803.1 ion transporter [Thermomonas sp.]